MSAWEVPPTLVKDIKREYKYGVILTGVLNTSKQPTDRIHIEKGADRIFHTLQLYKKGIIHQFIITGGTATVLHTEDEPEALLIKKQLMDCGVPSSDIIVEPLARNTHENATYTKKLLDSLGYQEKVLLVTSAFHMRRSAACFRASQINFDPYSTDQRTFTPRVSLGYWLIPSSSAFSTWDILFKEWIGYLSYWVAGYL